MAKRKTNPLEDKLNKNSKQILQKYNFSRRKRIKRDLERIRERGNQVEIADAYFLITTFYKNPKDPEIARHKNITLFGMGKKRYNVAGFKSSNVRLGYTINKFEVQLCKIDVHSKFYN